MTATLWYCCGRGLGGGTVSFVRIYASEGYDLTRARRRR